MKPQVLSIMQPYVFPYIGYFNLVKASSKIIFYDDVNYIKHGWINRNRILLDGQEFLFTVPVRGGSPNKLIMEVEAIADERFQRKFLAVLESAYRKAPFYQRVRDLVNDILNTGHTKIADLAINSITSIFQYLGETVHFEKSSVVSPQTKGMDKSDRIIRMTRDSGFKTYLNPAGGKELYSKEYFNNQGVELLFLEPLILTYRQFDNPFIPGLSIIDVLMFNDANDVKKLLSSFVIK